MSNLLSYASPWNDPNNAAKKRMPSIRRTKKNNADLVKNDKLEESDDLVHLEETQDKNDNITELQKTQEERDMKINQLISNMAQIDEDSTGLSDFQPLEHPLLQTIGQSQKPKKGDEEIHYLPNSMQSPPPRIEQTIGDFTSNNNEHEEQQCKTNPYSNYRRVYEPSKMMPPNNYYEKMGLGIQPTQDNKLMEKINYMIHMLEQQQNEKTNNITEEFILYMFLGIFIIFIVDSFSRSSLKYVR